MTIRITPTLAACTVFLAATTGCDVFLPLQIARCQNGDIPDAPIPTFEPDPDDSCMTVLTSDPAELPTYEQVLAETQCDAFISGVCTNGSGMALWQTGICNFGEYLFISIDGTFGGETMYFDGTTHRLAGISGRSDEVDPDCGAERYAIARIECTNPVVTGTICPVSPFVSLLP